MELCYFSPWFWFLTEFYKMHWILNLPYPPEVSKCYPSCKSLINLMLFYSLLREYMVPFKEARGLVINLRLIDLLPSFSPILKRRLGLGQQTSPPVLPWSISKMCSLMSARLLFYSKNPTCLVFAKQTIRCESRHIEKQDVMAPLWRNKANRLACTLQTWILKQLVPQRA